MNLPELPETERDAFYAAVWKLVKQIPAGKVSTYGQIASYLPPVTGVPPEEFAAHRARWVGNAMAASPQDVPWQRVINAQGKISARHAAQTQRRLLEQEGVQFDAKERVDLKQYGWQGPAADWLQANGYPEKLS